MKTFPAVHPSLLSPREGSDFNKKDSQKIAADKVLTAIDKVSDLNLVKKRR